MLPILEAQEHFDNDSPLRGAVPVCERMTGVKTGFVMWPIRTAVSGKQMTPAGATEIMEVLGKEESLARIRKGNREASGVQWQFSEAQESVPSAMEGGAGPGSGRDPAPVKTTVITNRIRYLTEEAGARPLLHSGDYLHPGGSPGNAGADISGWLGPKASGRVTFGTFHSVFFHHFEAGLPLYGRSDIVTEEEQRTLSGPGAAGEAPSSIRRTRPSL